MKFKSLYNWTAQKTIQTNNSLIPYIQLRERFRVG